MSSNQASTTGPARFPTSRRRRARRRTPFPAAPASGFSPGTPTTEYKGVAEFFEFLSQTDIQSRLHQISGYLPVTMAAYEATKASGFYENNPGREQPILQMTGKAPTENSRGIRAVNLPELREIQNEEFEAMLAGQESAQQALDNAVRRGNAAVKAALGEVASTRLGERGRNHAERHVTPRAPRHYLN